MWFREISIKNARKCYYKKLCKFIDVRTPEEYDEGHICGAINIPIIDIEEKKIFLDKKKMIIVYCQSGTRGMRAAKLMDDLGYNVFNLNGGYNKWKTDFC